ncbi:MAG: hypothetical protein ACXABY_15750 [Candidatus Thorarchaeota archaeon]
MYDNAKSATIAKHRQHGYATASVTDIRWFKSKDAFMGLVCKVFEQFYEEMKVGYDGSKSKSAD